MKILSNKALKIWKTLNLYFCSITSGMSMAVIGPTLIDLQNLVHTDTKTISYVYIGRSSGFIIGSLIGGVLYDMTKRKPLLLTFCNLLNCLTLFVLTWSTGIEVLTGLLLLNGIALGAIDTGMNVACLNLWGKDVKSFFQGLHFFYGVGGLISPLIVSPFLSRSSVIDTQQNNSNHSLLYTIPDNIEQDLVENLSSIPRIFYGYAILGCISLVVTGLLTMVCIIDPLDEAGKSKKEEVKEKSACFMAGIVIITFVLLFVETGIEIAYAQMAATYAVKGNLKLTPTIGSYITSTFWAAFAAARFFAIFLSLKFSNRTLIVFNLMVFSAGAVVLQFVATTERWALWLTSVLLGAGIGPFFPTVVALIEQYITVTNKILSLFVVAVSFGQMILPLVVGNFIEEVPEVLGFVVSASTMLSIAMSFVLYLILRNKEEKNVVKKGEVNPAFEASSSENSDQKMPRIDFQEQERFRSVNIDSVDM